MMDKQREYKQLIDDVREYYKNGGVTCRNGKKEFSFDWCDACKEEVNLWTYWQGAGDLSPDLLVVGQDWGHVSERDKCVKNIEAGRFYFEGVKGIGSATDRNLAALLNRVNEEWKPLEGRCEGLFFTNFILGYRSNGSTGGTASEWVTPEMENHFRRLVNILEPKAILCLGQSTFRAVVEAMTEKHAPNAPWIKTIENGPVYASCGKWSYPVFPLPHPGNNGVLSIRNTGRETFKNVDPIELAYMGWERIPDYLSDKRRPNCPVAALVGGKGFDKAFLAAQRRLMREGSIVIPVAPLADCGGANPVNAANAPAFEDMCRRAIELSDEVFVVGAEDASSSFRELVDAFASEHGKKARRLECE